MKLIVNGRFLSQRVTGVQRYAIETLRAFRTLSGISEPSLSVLAPGKQDKHSELFGSIEQIPFCSGHAWEQFLLPLFSCLRHVDCVLNLCNTYPIFCRRQIVVVHDASIYAKPEGYTSLFVMYYKFLYWCLKFKPRTKIVTVSTFSKNELVHYTGVSADRIKVVHNGADHWKRVVPDLSILHRYQLHGKRFLLAVASANPNKNLDRLVEAYNLLASPSVPLILVGGSNSRVFAENDRNFGSGVVHTGYITDSELAALYSQATAFVFPSLYEGFGLPPLEAMIFGCPVISSREASLPEVCGDAARYCDARDSADIALAMSEILDDEALRETLIRKGREQAASFTWEKTARGLLDVIKEFQ